MQTDGLTDHALWPTHPPDYVPATRDFGRRTRELTSTLLAILSMGLLGPDRGGTLEKALITHSQAEAGDEPEQKQ